MILVVPSVEVDVTRINEQEGKQDEENLDGVLASVHEVSIEHVRLIQGRHAILSSKQVRGKMV